MPAQTGFDNERYLEQQTAAILDRVERINGQPSFYQSPTDMGVNRAGFGIVNDDACRAAARQGIIRCYFNYACEYAMGLVDRDTVKTLAGIPDHIHLLPPLVTHSLSHFKTDVLKGKRTSLDLEETLISLSISATLNPVAETVIGHLKDLTGCEVHLSHIPSPGDAAGLRKLGVNTTSEPGFASKYLFVS